MNQSKARARTALLFSIAMLIIHGSVFSQAPSIATQLATLRGEVTMLSAEVKRVSAQMGSVGGREHPHPARGLRSPVVDDGLPMWVHILSFSSRFHFGMFSFPKKLQENLLASR